MCVTQGQCSIKYSAVSDQLQVSGATSPGAGISGDACDLDYIVISGAGATAGADSSSYDRWTLGRGSEEILNDVSDSDSAE